MSPLVARTGLTGSLRRCPLIEWQTGSDQIDVQAGIASGANQINDIGASQRFAMWANNANPSTTAARPNRQNVTAPFSCARSGAGH